MRRVVEILIGIAVLTTPSLARSECRQDDQCSGGPARFMLLLDASSETLNVAGQAGTMGQTDWDVLRQVLADDLGSLWDADIEPNGRVASQSVHFGAIVFGTAGEHKRIVDYGPCTRPNVEWALDPETSCVAPDCTNPWGGPPIEWTYLDGSIEDPPNFALQTLSHMPRCDGAGPSCEGSGRAVVTALELERSNRAAYIEDTPFVLDDTTLFVNVLFVSGSFATDAMETEVQAALETAFDEGVVTFVVGYGQGAAAATPEFSAELANMAQWGSGGVADAYVAADETALRMAVADIIDRSGLPCCRSIDCSSVGGADGGDPDGDGDGDGTQDDAADGQDDGDSADEWGSADGDGSASADEGGDAGDDGATAPGSGEIDDDGGCTCRTSGPGAALGLLVLIGLLRRRWD